MRNETEFIKCTKNRWLTAKAQKFVSRCVDIVASQNGYSRYHQQIKPIKTHLKQVLDHLFIDQKLSIEEIKVLIKNRKIDFLKLNI